MISKIILILKKAYISLFNKVGFMPILKDVRISKDKKDIKLYKTSTGDYFLPKYFYQDIIIKSISRNRIYDEDVYECSKNYITDNSCVLDLGASYGQMSVLMGKLKKNVTIHSFEANGYVFSILKKNLKINNTQSECYNVAITDNPKKKYYFPKSNPEKFKTLGSYSLRESIDEESQNNQIKSMKIDDIHFEKNISFMKIDIQGLDLEGMMGARNTIKEHKMPIIFEYESFFQNELNFNFQDHINFVNEIEYKFEKIIGCNNFLIVPK